jgi:hypothetical protein
VKGKELKADIPQNVGLYNPKLRGCPIEDIAAHFSTQVTSVTLEVVLCPRITRINGNPVGKPKET